MLILTRTVGTSIIIGDDILITVLGIKGNQVRLGTTAAKDVSVHRLEIYERIMAEQGKPFIYGEWSRKHDTCSITQD